MTDTVSPAGSEPRLGTPTRVFMGLGLGIATGIFLGEEAAVLRMPGDAFIAALQITVIPYVVVALITSLGRLTLADARALALKGGAVILGLWLIGILVVLASPLAFPDWPSASFFSATQIADQAPVDFLRLYIPSNVFYALTYAIVPAIVVFSILFGVALIRIETKARVVEFFDTVGAVLMTMAGFVGRLAPYGVFAITANAAGTIDIADLARLQVYVVLYVLLALLLSLWVIPGLIALLTPLGHGEVLQAFRGPLITAFATANLLIVLPLLAADGKRLMARHDGTNAGQGARAGDKPADRDSSGIDILIPAAFPFPSLGLVLSLMFVLFGGWLVGQSVAVTEYPTLALVGLASLFGGTVLALPFLLDLLRLPADLFQTFLAVDVINARFGTLVAGTHVIAVALIGSFALRGAVRVRILPLLRFAAISLVLLLAILGGVRAFYSFVFVAPFTKDQVLRGLPLLGEPQPHRAYESADALTPREPSDTDSLTRVRESGSLRVCHRARDYPSAFVNTQGDLVGFDIEMAHRFARQLGVEIVFVPIHSHRDAAERLNGGYCDVLMSLLPLAPEMTLEFALTRPVIESAVGLVVEDHRRREFRTWEESARVENLRVLTAEGSASLRFVEQRLPQAAILRIDDMSQLDSLLADRPPRFDAVLMPAEEGAVWTILHPRFNLVTPAPVLVVPFGYAAAHGEREMQAFLDAWVGTVRGAGVVDRLYRYWMLGDIAETRAPRWSVARNLLGWLD